MASSNPSGQQPQGQPPQPRKSFYNSFLTIVSIVFAALLAVVAIWLTLLLVNRPELSSSMFNPFGPTSTPQVEKITVVADRLVTVIAPTQTAYPTYTPAPHIEVTRVVEITSAPVIITATPEQPATTPTPSSELLYQADWSQGLAGWSGTSDWKSVDSMIVNDGGTGPNSLVLAPPLPEDVKNYAIEAEIQVVRSTNICGDYGIFFRGSDRNGYTGGLVAAFCTNGATQIAGTTGANYGPDKNWHTYRIEAKGNTYRLLIDGSAWVETIDNTYLEGSQIGLIDKNMVINVRSFKVFKL